MPACGAVRLQNLTMPTVLLIICAKLQVEFAPEGAEEWFAQSAAFVVITVPGRTNPFDHNKEVHRL